MDILISSNLERLLYHLSGQDTEQVTTYMKELQEKKSYTVSDHIKEGLSSFYGGWADMDETHSLASR